MKLENFEFSKNLIALEVSGQHIDLHNLYELTAHEYSGSTLTLNWRKTNEVDVPQRLPNWVRLVVSDVEYFDIRGKPTDGLDEFGFFPNDTLGKVEYNGIHHPESGTEVLVFRFCGGGDIAVIGGSARVEKSL